MARRGQKRSRSGQVIPQANAAQTIRALHAKLVQLDIVLGAVIRIVGKDKVQAEVDQIASEISSETGTPSVVTAKQDPSEEEAVRQRAREAVDRIQHGEPAFWGHGCA